MIDNTTAKRNEIYLWKKFRDKGTFVDSITILRLMKLNYQMEKACSS